MGLFERFRDNRIEKRAEGEVQFDDALLQALLGTAEVSRDTALQIPTVSGGIDLIANIIASTPIKLYRDEGGKAIEIRDDYRIPLLNDETGDTLNSNEFWHAMVRDYYLGKGGYAYICKQRGKIKSIHYVDEQEVSIQKNNDPIFKEFDILVQGNVYKPWDFLRILRNTKNGAEGIPITVENSKLISVAYQQLMLEYSMAKRGGNKKGFLKAEGTKRLDEGSMNALKAAWRKLNENNSDNMMILNSGIDFKESSDTAAEMQLDENKRSNATEFAKLFHVSAEAISGRSDDVNAIAKLAAIPLMQVIQCALNRDILLEKEKKEYYWAFDTKELLKGNIRERFEAYKTALDANFMQIDEVRYEEDMEPLGLTWIKLGLNDVLYDPKTKQIYTPNTNQTTELGEVKAGEDSAIENTSSTDLNAETAVLEESELHDDQENVNIEPRGGDYIQDPTTGRMNGSSPSKKTSAKKKNTSGHKYSPSKQRNHTM